jgi:hypothetical protein
MVILEFYYDVIETYLNKAVLGYNDLVTVMLLMRDLRFSWL